MSWAIGYDEKWKRDIGRGVPAFCDHPGCTARIDRGLGHVCADGVPYGGGHGCGLYFCAVHQWSNQTHTQLCERCAHQKEPFTPSEEHPDWIRHKLHHESWQQWRDENPDEVAKLKLEHFGSGEWHVYRVNDYDWWLGRSLAEVKTNAARFYGMPEDEACDEGAHPLTLRELEATEFYPDGNHNGTPHSFAEELSRRIAAGARVELFATTEF